MVLKLPSLKTAIVGTYEILYLTGICCDVSYSTDKNPIESVYLSETESIIDEILLQGKHLFDEKRTMVIGFFFMALSNVFELARVILQKVNCERRRVRIII